MIDPQGSGIGLKPIPLSLWADSVAPPGSHIAADPVLPLLTLNRWYKEAFFFYVIVPIETCGPAQLLVLVAPLLALAAKLLALAGRCVVLSAPVDGHVPAGANGTHASCWF